MRRLSILECNEPTQNMESSREGRYCHRCAHAVHALDRLEERDAEALLQREGRLCVEVRVERSRAVLAHGALAAFGVLVVGCAGHGGFDEPLEAVTPEESYEVPGTCDPLDESGQCEPEYEGIVFGQPVACDAPPIQETVAPDEASGEDAVAGGSIRGLITDKDSKKPVPYAFIVLTSDALEQQIEVQSNEQGTYKVTDLPPGHYGIEVYFGADMVTKKLELPKGDHLKADFAMDTTRQHLRGVVVQVDSTPVEPAIDTTTAAAKTTVRMD